MNSRSQPPAANLRDYLLIKDAAARLGVSTATLRNWDRAGKITAYRNPINGYRLFRKSDLDELLTGIQRSSMQRNGDPPT